MAELNRTIVTKLEFAEMKRRAKSAVSNWIKEGKISPAALIGSGVRARIWVERAEADLAGALDEAQQMAQAQPVTAPGASIDDDTLRERREADMRRARSDADLAELKLAKESGRWIETEKAQQAWGKELSRIVAEHESFIVNRLAREIAEEHGLDWKGLAVKVREKYRAFRGAMADDASAAG